MRDTRDATENAWGNFVVQPTGHPVLQIFEGQNNPLLEGVKIFRWWHGSVAKPGTLSDGATVVAQFSNAEKSPAMVEKAYGQGRVMAITTAADMDWGNWPQDPSYVITMQELSRYLARKTVEQGSIVVGEPIRQPLDLTRYKLDVSLVHPDQTRSALQPREIVDEPERASSSIWSVDFDRTDRRGFYQMQLTRNSGEPENVLFAANIDLAEANLQRVNLDILQSRLANTPVTFVRGSGLLALMARDAKRELSLLVLGMLGIVLCTEHSLAWWFGLRR